MLDLESSCYSICSISYANQIYPHPTKSTRKESQKNDGEENFLRDKFTIKEQSSQTNNNKKKITERNVAKLRGETREEMLPCSVSYTKKWHNNNW